MGEFGSGACQPSGLCLAWRWDYGFRGVLCYNGIAIGLHLELWTNVLLRAVLYGVGDFGFGQMHLCELCCIVWETLARVFLRYFRLLRLYRSVAYIIIGGMQ